MNGDGTQHRKYWREEKERRDQRGAEEKKTVMRRREQRREEKRMESKQRENKVRQNKKGNITFFHLYIYIYKWRKGENRTEQKKDAKRDNWSMQVIHKEYQQQWNYTKLYQIWIISWNKTIHTTKVDLILICATDILELCYHMHEAEATKGI